MLLRSYETSVDEPTLLALSDDVFLAAWDEREEEPGPIDISIDGVPADRSRASLRLTLAGEGTRRLLAFRVPGRSEGELSLDRNGVNLARLIVTGAETPGLERLLAGLEESARARLLGFALGICRGAFRLAEDARFLAFCRKLAEAILPVEPIDFTASASLTEGEALFSAPLAPSLGAIEAVYFLGRQSITANRFTPILLTGEAPARMALVAPRGPNGLVAILVGRDAASLVRLPRPRRVPSIASLAERGELGETERRYVLRCLGQLAADAEAAATARAIQIFAPERRRDLVDPKRPVGAALELAVGCGAGGVFLRGWVRDPHQLIGDAELISPFGETSIKEHWHRLPRPDLEKRGVAEARPGFVARVPIVEPIPVLQHRLRLTLGGGALDIVPPLKAPSEVEARNLVLASVPPQDLTEDLLSRILAPAAAELHRRAMAQQSAPEIVEIGRPPSDPAVSFIIPLYRNLGFLRMQIGAFAIDPEIRREVELVYVLDSPEQRGELEHLLRGLHALTGLPFRLVIMSANFGYAAANNTGVRAARGRTLLLLNSDVVPIVPGWLGTMRAALAEDQGGDQVGAVGPKLLFDDGSLQHAGLTFERDFQGHWYNTHFFKGYPRDWPAANKSREVPGVTGAAMLLPRAVYETVGGFTEDYVIGDYEDSDLCLKIRAEGCSIRYEPAAELHHFERRSIELHAGYVQTAASAYNRRLHAERWSTAMDRLMVDFADSDPAPMADLALHAGARR